MVRCPTNAHGTEFDVHKVVSMMRASSQKLLPPMALLRFVEMLQMRVG